MNNEPEAKRVCYAKDKSIAAPQAVAAPAPSHLVINLLDDDDDTPMPNAQVVAWRTTDRLVWPCGDMSLELWLAATRPSQTTEQECAWIQIHNNVPSSPGYSLDSLSRRMDDAPYQAVLEQLKVDLKSSTIRGAKGRLRTACQDALVDIAIRQNYTMGKWMLHWDESKTDACWERVARATAQGALGSSAKVAPILHRTVQTSRPVLCCIYVDDFTDHAEMKRVLLALEEMNFDVKSGFKPDFFTYLNIYSNNPWGLSPTLYNVAEVKQW